MMKLKFIYIVTILVFAGNIFGQDLPDPMDPPRMVNDFSGLLSSSDRDQLEGKLQDYYYRSSSQIYIVIVDDLHGYDISDFAFQLGDKWGIGTREKNNGILILLNPSPDKQKGKAFIATGYGLEEFVPDAIANRIVTYDMIPYFKEQKYFEGLVAASNTIIELTDGAYTADEYLQSHGQSPGPVVIIPFLIIFLVIVSTIWSRRPGRGSAVGHNLPLWALLFMASGSHHSHSGSFGNFSSGGGSFGGFGGFGGGGGGSFGGGGAGGSW